jgi:hypothetical protein
LFSGYIEISFEILEKFAIIDMRFFEVLFGRSGQLGNGKGSRKMDIKEPSLSMLSSCHQPVHY